MDNFVKRTSGEVQQRFEKNKDGNFICTGQEFMAGDVCDYVDDGGEFVDPPKYVYQSYNMVVE